MFENIFKTKQEKPPEEILNDFEDKEQGVVVEALGFLENAEPEKFKKSSANMLLALALFIGASTSFASEKTATVDNLPAMGEPQISSTEKKRNSKNDVAGFDIRKISEKIEISVNGRKEKIGEFNAEEIVPFWDGRIGTGFGIAPSKPGFYRDFTNEDIRQVLNTTSLAILQSQKADDFFKNLTTSESSFSDKQKALSLQQIGQILGSVYDYDMLKSGDHVSLSEDTEFQALKAGLLGTDSASKAGICGNIHTFLTRIAEKLGLEAWLQTGSSELGNHVWSGMVLGDGVEKQIAFLDYGTLVPTGTLNYRNAIGVMERKHKSVSVFNNFVENDGKVFQVKSRASEVIEKAAGVEGSMNILGRNFKNDDVFKKEAEVEVNISPEIKELKITSQVLGVSFFRFEDVYNNPYQAMEDMSAIRVGGRWSNDRLGMDLGATVLNMNVKDLYGGTTEVNELISRAAFDYLDDTQLIKSKYGEFVASFGATIESAIKIPLDKKVGTATLGAMTSAAFGVGMIYINPNETGKFYIRAEEAFVGRVNDLQNQDTTVSEIERKLVVGADVKVFEGSVLNIEAGKSKLIWGDAMSIKGGLTEENIKMSAGYEKADSNQARFLPSTEKTNLEIGYTGGPKWKVDISGSKTREKYQDAQSNDIYTAEVKLRMFLW